MKLLHKKALILTVLGVSANALAAQGSGTGGSKGSSGSSRPSGTTQSSPATSNSSTSTNSNPGVGSSNSAVNPNTTVQPGSNNNSIENPSNSNNTGSSVYNNRTGAPNTNTSGTQGTRSTTRPNAAVTQVLTMDGVKAEDNAKVVQFAREAGASDARMEGNTLKYSGETFNQARFNSLVTGSFPGVNINR